jgi:hypothetical protein
MPKEILTIPQSKSSPDQLLYLMLDFLRSLPSEKRTAVVAGVYSLNRNKLIVATSYQFRDPKTNQLVWNHAEQEVLNTLGAKAPADTDSYLFVSSLSTCARPSSTRAHVSCTNLLVSNGFISEHVGKIDRNAATTGLYKDLGFTPTLTTDPVLLSVCSGLYRFFVPFKKKGWPKQRIIDAALSQMPSQFYIQT